MPPEVKARLRPESAEVMSLAPPQSAAIGYARLLQGTADASLFWRAYPWDHAPGSLMLEESGGAVLRLDGIGVPAGVHRVRAPRGARPPYLGPTSAALVLPADCRTRRGSPVGPRAGRGRVRAPDRMAPTA